jgi:hypothetical protein
VVGEPDARATRGPAFRPHRDRRRLTAATSPGHRPGRGHGSTLAVRKGADMTDKSPRKTANKKPGKSLKEKRQVKKEKQARKG